MWLLYLQSVKSKIIEGNFYSTSGNNHWLLSEKTSKVVGWMRLWQNTTEKGTMEWNAKKKVEKAEDNGQQWVQKRTLVSPDWFIISHHIIINLLRKDEQFYRPSDGDKQTKQSGIGLLCIEYDRRRL